MIKIGCCGGLAMAGAIKDAGFDYMEAPLTSLLGDEEEEVFAPVLENCRLLPIAVPAFNLFLPGGLRIVGPDVDEARIGEYVRRSLSRAVRVGAERVVLGSGGSRNVPEGFLREEAEKQFAGFLSVVADAAEVHSLTVVIEPLNRKETNLINSVSEGVAFAKEVNRPSIQVLADFYHMDEEGEPLSSLADNADWIRHIHVADTGRLAPGTGEYPYAEFSRVLKEAGYEGMISVECSWRDFGEEAPRSVEFLRELFG